MLKNSLYQISNLSGFKSIRRFLALCAFFISITIHSQIANYVLNGGFEDKWSCSGLNELNKAKGWNCIGWDTTIFGGFIYSVDCFNNAPSIPGVGFQYPKSGNTFYRLQSYCTNPCNSSNARNYSKSRLKTKLVANKTYCAKMYVVLQESSPYAIDGFGFYFGDDSIDSIKVAHAPLNYIPAQVNNPSGNIITDTLIWTPVSGTFVATGNEKYMVIGNFLSDVGTNLSLMIPAQSTYTWSEYFVDDVSCIPIDLPAYAGHDTTCIPGTTVYIGRTRDVGIDEACTWYQLPNMTTPIAQAVAGLSVSPAQTTTYVVKQQLWCSGIKYDTVVVFKDALGLRKQEALNDELKIYPVPAKNAFSIKAANKSFYEDLEGLTLYDAFGNKLRYEELKENPERDIDISDLAPGIYFVILVNTKGEKIVKKLIISNK